MQATVGFFGLSRATLHAVLERVYFRVRVHADCFAHPPEVFPDIGKGCGIERHQRRRAGEARSDGSLDIPEADRADIALHLGQDVSRLQAFEDVVEDFVNGESAAGRVLHLLVDGTAVGIHIDQRLRTRGKRTNRRGIIALMRAPDEEIERAKGVDHLGCAREQRDDAAAAHSKSLSCYGLFGGCGPAAEKLI